MDEEQGCARVIDFERCTVCRQCELHCPDYCIYVD
ncbi:4Fe-4S binding protein [Desulfofundulus thermocisternus]|nr:4Fe-4S binding protein [Desulfofundulus thermocisternus]MCS5694710.1 4Fe-4S binding protein [Desulfofundulus thermocisternus]